MRLLFVHAHPVPESLNAALCRTAVETARERGHEVRLIDLHAERFDPVISADERRAYPEAGPPPEDVAPHVEALCWAEGLIFVYPTWWYAQPAILKGWFDRVWRPGIAFSIPRPGEPLRGSLSNIRLIGVITTLGSPWWFWTFLIGAPGRRIILRGLRYCTARRTQTFWLALHDIDTAEAPARARFIARVRSRIARIPL